MYVRWTTFKCPSCNSSLESRVVTSPRVNVEFKKCRSCGFTYRTPDKEWQHMSKGQRIGYFLNEWAVAVLGLSLLCAAIFYKTDWQASVWAVGIGVACCAPFWLWKLFKVRRSIARTSALIGQENHVSGDVQGFEHLASSAALSTQPLPKSDAPMAQAPKKTSRLSLGWKIRLALIGAVVIFAVLDDNWATVDKYFPQLNSVIHSGTPSSDSDFDYHYGHIKDGWNKLAALCGEGTTFKECRASLLANKPTLVDMRQHLQAINEGWSKEKRERSVPADCQKAMDHFLGAYEEFLNVKDRELALLQSIDPDSAEDIKASRPRIVAISDQEDTTVAALQKSDLGGVCNGY